jgi:hypothetical protein
MRCRAVVGLAVWGVALASGCKGGDAKAGEAKQALAESTEIVEQEDDVLARREALVRSRQRVRGEREKLAEQRRQAIASGADPAALDEADTALIDEEKRLVAEEESLDAKIKEVIRQRREMTDALASGTDQGARVAAREGRVADRERDFAGREQRLADREAALAEREQALAKRERETCGVAQPIIRTVDVKGSRYTKKDVEPLLTRARSAMSKKGILASDLPAPAQELEQEATKAMAEGDYGRARFAASQLLATVEAMRVDKGFIAAKIQRLNGAIRGKSIDDAKQGEVDDLFRGATADYGDGKFGDANRKLNRIFAAVR